MSDRTRVIICWPCGSDDAPHRLRAQHIADALPWLSLAHVETMGDRLVCEAVAVYGTSLFDLGSLREVIVACDWWDRPREVEVFWKGEEDPSYQHWRMCDDRG